MINDTGSSGADYIQFKNLATAADVTYYDFGDGDLYITNTTDGDGGVFNDAVVIKGYFNGTNNIEQFYTADGYGFMI